jgi:hypothetical protein
VDDPRKARHVAALFVLAVAAAPHAANAQQGEGQSCAEPLTQQLRRFSAKCLSDLVAYVAAQAKMGAKIYSESEKYYILVSRDGDGLRADAVSRFNFPFMKEGTENTLKQLGWQAPENESDNWRKRFTGDHARTGAAAEDLAKALAAYGLTQGQAISLTVGADVTN